MRDSRKILFTILITILFCNCSYSQSFYNIKFRFDKNDTASTVHMFLVLNEDGSGFARLRYLENQNDIVVEADATEYTEGNHHDSLHVTFGLFNPRLISGKGDKPAMPYIYFETGTDGVINPLAVLPSSFKEPAEDKAEFFHAEHILLPALRKDFLLQYFSEDDDFYQSVFSPVKKGFSDPERGSKMYLLVVTNTNDKTIGSACRYDKERIIQTFTTFSSFIGSRMITDTVSGNRYSKKNVESAIKKLNPGRNDMVIFYYSGHGFRKKGQASSYPLIDLRAKPSDDHVKESLSMEEIYRLIKLKKARFNLVMSDCCNTEVPEVPVVASKPLKTKSSGVNWSENNIRQLFFSKTPVSILATAANAGQKATCNSSFGGFFSWFFKGSLESSCNVLKAYASWDEIFQQTQKLTINKAKFTYCAKPYIPENICDQSPIYTLEIAR